MAKSPRKTKTKPKAKSGIPIKTGRSSFYTPELGKQICDLVAERVPVAVICARTGMPSKDTLYRWKREISEFSDLYARARDHRADARADYIDDITGRCLRGEVKADVPRVVIDAEKWLMAKERPRTYGDKIAQEITGTDGEPFYKKETPLETARWIAWILTQGDRELDRNGATDGNRSPR